MLPNTCHTLGSVGRVIWSNKIFVPTHGGTPRVLSGAYSYTTWAIMGSDVYISVRKVAQSTYSYIFRRTLSV